ncbi:MAG: hypothetical protein AB7F88_17735 [Pyrinomonadaceae bacterium]
MKKSGLVLILVCSLCLGQSGDKPNNSKVANTSFEKVSLCQLADSPGTFNRKPVEVAAFVSHGFEDSSIFDAGCGERYSGIWMEYGGTASTSTMYCCGFTPKSTRPTVLKVEGVELPLVANDNFKTLNTLLHEDHGRIVRAILRGTFFSGKQDPYRNGKTTQWGGYGHMGCCSLFVIQEVVSVLPHDIDGLDYASSVDQPDTDREGCGSYQFHDGGDWKNLIDQQHKADNGTDIWRYDSPEKVASEALAKLLHKQPAAIKLEETRKASGRIVYHWRPNRQNGVRYMVVVNRPYSLSLQAKEPARTIWTVAQMYSICN